MDLNSICQLAWNETNFWQMLKTKKTNITVKFIKSNKGWQLINFLLLQFETKSTDFKTVKTKLMTVIMRRLILGSFISLSRDQCCSCCKRYWCLDLVLLVWVYAQYHTKHSWFFKCDAEKYANIHTICDYLGRDVWESVLN